VTETGAKIALALIMVAIVAGAVLLFLYGFEFLEALSP
jgi:hypothetical protein